MPKPNIFHAPFTQLLGLRPGDVVSVIGCGGKTTLIHRLAQENRHRRVLLSTTTKIIPPPASLLDWCLAPGEEPRQGINLLCQESGPKLSGVSPEMLQAACPPDGLTLLEADGSRRLPLKGWADHEPVIPSFTTMTIGVIPLWTIGHFWDETLVHRPLLFEALTGSVKGDAVTLHHIASMINHPLGMFRNALGQRVLLISQVEDQRTMKLAKELKTLLPPGFARVLAGSAQQNKVTEL